jgi:AcrR family transcriptional regulator
MKQAFEKRSRRRVPPRRGHPPAKAAPSEGTKDAILQAAMRVLARDGFPALTARNIAAEAGTNLALLNYHYGSKEKLLIALFDALNAERLARQRAMYSEPNEPLSAKWRRATAFYRQDLAAGWVRVLNELIAHGYSNAKVGNIVREQTAEWRSLLAEAARDSLPSLGIDLPAEFVGSAVASFWLGMESQHLIGATEREGHFFEILERIGDWLEARERRGGKRSARARAD